MKRAAIFVLIVTGVVTAQVSPTLTAEQVLEKNLEATGGRAKWSQVKTIVKIGTFEAHSLSARLTPGAMRAAEMKGSVRWYEALPDRYMVLEENDQSGSSYFGCNHDVEWWYLRGVSAGQKQAKPKDCDVTVAPGKWSDRYEKAEVKGTKKINGRNAYELRLAHKGQNITLFIDAENFLLLRSSGVHAFRGSTPTAQQTDFADYADVDGLKFAYTTTENINQGQRRTHYTQIYVDARIADSMFEPQSDKTIK